VVLRADHVGSVLAAVSAGLGLGVLPSGLAERHQLDRIGKTVLGKNPIWSIVHQDLLHNARVRAMMGFVGALFERERRALAGT